MNRPKMDSYDLSTKFTMCEFIRDLEKYCNELEKREQPMIVRKKSISEEVKVGNITFKLNDMWYCPNCESWISPSHDERYCSCCGQRLEYEDE